MINKVTLIGHLGKDPEVRHLESGVAVGRFTLATNESYMDKASNEWQNITTWHDIVVWRNLAERAEKQLGKGKLVYVDGKLQKRKWTDKDGIDRWNVEIVANTFRLLEKRESTGGGYLDQSFPTAADAPSSNPVKSGTPVANSPSGGSLEDDLPF
ncbi:UNVERIFIED_CONTAM: hypothetical protein GTU68_019228 [Idotea baltica]|nr:hypothetical protein [Idotea baltica]